MTPSGPPPVVRIGIDFDNTIAGYDRLFAAVAVEDGLFDTVPAGGKTALRDALRRRGEDGEIAWQFLQAKVYGPRMGEAELIDGVAAFLAECRHRDLEVFVVSHKTRHARRDTARAVDMREAALAWMAVRGFFRADGFGLSRDRVFFEDTREAKVARIASLGCAHFVDDLEEVFLHPGFPAGVGRYLLAPAAPADAPATAVCPFHVFQSWHGIRNALLPAP